MFGIRLDVSLEFLVLCCCKNG